MAPYLADHDSPWLFPGSSKDRPLTHGAARNICVHAARLARLPKSVTITTLRHSAARLQVRDIDSGRMVIHIRQSKGRKDRYVP